MGNVPTKRRPRRRKRFEVVEKTAQTIALAKQTASKHWPGLLLRLGVPLTTKRRPVIIARYASGDDEDVRLMTLDIFRSMMQKLEHLDDLGPTWKLLMRKLSPPLKKALSDYSEVDVPATFQRFHQELKEDDDDDPSYALLNDLLAPDE